MASNVQGRLGDEIKKITTETKKFNAEEFMKERIISILVHHLALFQVEPTRVDEILEEVKKQYLKPKNPCINCENRK